MSRAVYLNICAALIVLALAWHVHIFEGAALADTVPSIAGGGLQGTVYDEDGGPLSDVMVTATHADTGIAVSVFTAADGAYHIDGLAPGAYRVKAWSQVRLGEETTAQVDDGWLELNLSAPADAMAARRAPSSQWLGLLPDSDKKREFIVNCTACHEIGWERLTDTEGAARSKEGWAQVIEMMRAIDEYELIPPDFDDDEYAAWLAESFSPENMSSFAPSEWELTDAVRTARITEYDLPKDDSLPHDLVLGPDGRLWITAFFYDLIWALDPKTGAYQTYQVKPAGESAWGQTRALKCDGQGILWIILGGTHQLVRLDPETGDIQSVDIGMYAHSLDIDSQGRIWFNDYFSKQERIGFYDPETGEVAGIDVPSAGLTEAQGLPLPYGLQVNRRDQLFSTQLAASTLVQYDIASGTGKLFEMPTPNAGPRRPALRADGAVWIPEWNTGHLTLFDPANESFTRYRVGPSSLGAYDVETDPRTGVVWITGALDSSMLRFDPATGAVDRFPLPTEPAYTRHLAVDPDNSDLWSAYASLPAVKPKLVHIQLAE